MQTRPNFGNRNPQQAVVGGPAPFIKPKAGKPMPGKAVPGRKRSSSPVSIDANAILSTPSARNKWIK